MDVRHYSPLVVLGQVIQCKSLLLQFHAPDGEESELADLDEVWINCYICQFCITEDYFESMKSPVKLSQSLVGSKVLEHDLNE